ncbi:ABC transporter ATP-binding protein [Nocardioides daeguensis]|uniref:ABC transporter ATP-binding protein n=1 Tax=Nocardioides daeguensis TaxID=908359 RepID=A0ABP6UUD2_9ACTN|nr:ABC transporter ATP-binding protein [Nocardioides daeguensis]MBV6728360.1 ABC transporter ATP-binding protein [Nocardioides daeguensis]MCR1773169.1 ABC transporter ATP-binding protein [Nocardioides daeguensis]
MGTEDPAVRTRGLSKRFGKNVALSRLDLTVAPGTICGFLGPNGAGKTTAIKLLAGLYRPSAGTVEVFGRDVTRARDTVQASIGYLPGDFTGYADQTGRRFLRLVADLRGGVDETFVAELAQRLELDLDRRIGTLSRGNRQKVGIVQAFMNRAPLLLLDEPTSGLDPLMQREFRRLLVEARDRGQTVLLSSHVLSEVAEVADDVAILREGRLLDLRSMAELRSGVTRRVDLSFGDHVPAARIRQVPGVRNLSVHGLTAQVDLAGPVGELLGAVLPDGLVDVRTHETGLADVFLGYYTKERTDAHDLPQSPVGPAPDPARLG